MLKDNKDNTNQDLKDGNKKVVINNIFGENEDTVVTDATQ